MARYSFVLASLVLIAMMAYVTCETPLSGTVSTGSDDAEDDDGKTPDHFHNSQQAMRLAQAYVYSFVI